MNELVVSASLAARLSPHLGGIHAGARIADAIERVLHAQKQYMAAAAVDRGMHAPCGPLGRVLTVARDPAADSAGACKEITHGFDAHEARELTDRIRLAIEDVAMLLLEAHEGRAWAALGYSTWAEYVSHEFRFTKQRSFQLLDHARFVRAIEDATGKSTAVDLPERASRDLKPLRRAVVEAVRLRAAHVPEDELPNAVRSIVDEHRDRARASRVVNGCRSDGSHVAHRVRTSSGDRPAAGFTVGSVLRLCDAVDTLVRMPSPPEVVSCVPSALGHRLKDVSEAARWLSDFARRWEGAHGTAPEGDT